MAETSFEVEEIAVAAHEGLDERGAPEQPRRRELMSNEMLPNVIKGRIWLGDLEDPLNRDPVLSDQAANLKVEESDVDEIDLHATLPVHENALVTLSMTREQARQVGTHLINAANQDG